MSTLIAYVAAPGTTAKVAPNDEQYDGGDGYQLTLDTSSGYRIHIVGSFKDLEDLEDRICSAIADADSERHVTDADRKEAAQLHAQDARDGR